jgi:hypothetical protein
VFVLIAVAVPVPMAVMTVMTTVTVMLVIVIVRRAAARRRIKIACAPDAPEYQARKSKHHDHGKHQRQFDSHGDSSLAGCYGISAGGHEQFMLVMIRCQYI